jgi:hypothetical protein
MNTWLVFCLEIFFLHLYHATRLERNSFITTQFIVPFDDVTAEFDSMQP